MKQDDLVKKLEKEEDFMASKTVLEEELEKLGARVVFGVKFHPELMAVESVYRCNRCRNRNKNIKYVYISVFRKSPKPKKK